MGFIKKIIEKIKLKKDLKAFDKSMNNYYSLLLTKRIIEIDNNTISLFNSINDINNDKAVALVKRYNYLSNMIKEHNDSADKITGIIDGFNFKLEDELKKGLLILRASGDNRKFYGCNNYPYCDYTNDNIKAVRENRRCRVCGDFMVIRKGKYGVFYGCSSYPKCKHTIFIS